jgi:zinc carboxypeptidase
VKDTGRGEPIPPRHQASLALLFLVLASAGPESLVTYAAPASEAPSHVFWPDGTYDPKVPRPDTVLGYEVGARVTEYPRFERYLRALETGCDRIRVSTFGESYEGRALYLAVITSPKNLEALESIRESNLKLADPRTLSDPKEGDRLVQSNPAIAWMNYANDGNETAALEAAMITMYQLCAGTDEITRSIVDRLVVIVTPALNPDSRERFVSFYNGFHLGPSGSPDPQALEHHAPWGLDTNYNHYQIDLNRDAGLMTQQESRAMGRAYLRWQPQVFVDHHGETTTMFFPPVVEPVNRNVPDTTLKWHDIFGKAIAEGFDRFGWSYFVGEYFDDFYFGYWDTYPNLHGAVGMTFETDGGGSNGLSIEREDGTLLTLRDGVHHHFIATMQTLRTTAARREEKLRDFYAFRRGNLETGRHRGIRTYVIPPGSDPGRAWSLASVLVQDGIEVRRAKEPFSLDRVHNYDDGKVERRSFPAGTYIVPMSQPASAVAHALLEKDPELPESFVEAQRKRKEKKLKDEFYDISAWSLPVAFGVDTYWSESDPRAATDRVGEERPDDTGRVSGGQGRYGYLISGASNAGLALAVRLLRDGYVVAVADKGFGVGGRDWPRGTIVVRSERNPSSLPDAIARGARDLGVDVAAVDSAWTDRGVKLGSSHIRMIRLPRVAVIAGEGTDPNSYGAIWFLFERDYGLPFTPIALSRIGQADLRKYDVIVFPDGDEWGSSYEDVAREREIEALKGWARLGGVLIGVRRGAAFLASCRHGLTTANPMGEEGCEQKTEEDAETKEPRGETGAASTTTQEEWLPENTPGSLLRVELSPDHYLSMGYGSTAAVLVYSDLVFNPSKKGSNVARYASGDRLRIGGFVWPTAAKKLSGTPYLVEEPVGEGKLILFADDPNFRLMLRGLNRLFLNAVLFSPYLDSEVSVF